MTRFTPRSVFAYDDPLQFMIDAYDDRKRADSAFSTRRWAAQMGLDGPAPLVAILKGKRPVRVAMASFLARGLGLDPEESLFFKTLILRRGATSQDQIELFDQLLARLRPATPFSSVYTPVEAVFDHWSIMAILSAARLGGKPLSRAKLREVYDGYVRPELLDEGIALLKAEGLLSESADGVLSPAYGQVSSRNESANRGARRYYAQVLDLAKEAIEAPLSEREMQSFSFAIADGKLALGKEILRDTRNRLLALEDDSGTRVFQTHLQMFAISRSLDAS